MILAAPLAVADADVEAHCGIPPRGRGSSAQDGGPEQRYALVLWLICGTKKLGIRATE